MSQQTIAYVDIRFCAHATEDIDKVIAAAKNVLPENTEEDVMFSRSNVEGHYGNPITFFETRIKNRETAQAVVEKLAANLNSLDKDELDRNINRYVEKGSLYIRLDKQAAYQNKIKLVTSDPIHVRIRFQKSKTENVIEACRQLGVLP